MQPQGERKKWTPVKRYFKQKQHTILKGGEHGEKKVP